MGKDNPTRATRLPDEMDAEFVEYRDAKGMNNSEAIRELIRPELEKYHGDDEPDRTPIDDLLLSTASNLSTIAIVVALVAAAGLLTPAAAGLVGGVSLLGALVAVGEVRYRALRELGPLATAQEVSE